MARPVTLFTGQWADLTLEELARKCGEWVSTVSSSHAGGPLRRRPGSLGEAGYIEGRWEILRGNGLNCWAISTHLVGQAVCDPIDARHQATLPPMCGATAIEGVPTGPPRRSWTRPGPLPTLE